ncbi:hypothetical protein, partial [Klebsiella pneumoniae]|uniref:hypothetical protein n=1 Tax=Klebsiella pneumoniae TaxID=573 RepID=UPI00272F8F97
LLPAVQALRDAQAQLQDASHTLAAYLHKADLDPERLAELGSLIVEPRPRGPLDIVVYKSVGIGLEDVALARVVARRLGLC